MKIVVVAHYSRRDRAERLAGRLGAHVVMDEIGNGALFGHRKALEWCSVQDERCVIMEDDALPVPDFRAKAQAWLDDYPDSLLSFYLGTGRPPQYQPQIAHAVTYADDPDAVLCLPQLIHGVCYSIPQQYVRAVVERLPLIGAADFAIGNAWRAVSGEPVVYTIQSLVDHDDLPSVEVHPDGQKRTEPRRAWRLETANGR
ncbi:hypothetical protein [Brucella pseudintermedia]|uniref:hypothetical protein n=1 Tax=Brucella pseudintermedia TaxID=370111 RepID=UPI00124C62BF|nr:hypothetical protein [Brucella pseudintermedia]KAB2680329.1 hypothetical protein F9K78_16700 [Brucella pseudintermedia]